MAAPNENAQSKPLKVNLSGATKSERIKARLIRKPKDIIVYVPGTTDPVNASGDKSSKNSANRTYWAGDKKFYNLVKELKKKYHDLHILDIFSWSGDNSKDERDAAGLKLKDLLVRYYKGFRNSHVSFHLISHSHGGNVVIECLNQMGDDSAFPINWKIKSLTFLSTPFFKELHVFSDAAFEKFDPECEILNVYNDYDLTQRVVADFTMNQIPNLEDSINNGNKLYTNIDKLKNLDTVQLKHLADKWMSTDEATAVLTVLVAAVPIIQSMLTDIITIVGNINRNHPKFLTDSLKSSLVELITKIRKSLNEPKARFEKELAEVSFTTTRLTLLDAIKTLSGFITLVNELIDLDTTTYSSDLIKIVDEMLMTQMDYYDNTQSTPDHLINGKFKIIPLDITEHDPYHNIHPSKQSNFKKFISNVEKVEKKYEALNDKTNNPKTTQATTVRFELLFNLFAQLNHNAGEIIPEINGYLGWLEYAYMGGKFETEIENLQKHLSNYQKLLTTLDCDIIADRDRNATTRESQKDQYGDVVKDKKTGAIQFVKKGMMDKLGSIAYLAVKSHGVSHTELFPNVEKALINTFESGDNPGYKKVSRHKLILDSKMEQYKEEQKVKDAQRQKTLQQQAAARQQRDSAANKKATVK